MTKSDVARMVAQELDCPISMANAAVDAVFRVLTLGLVKEKGVRIPSFGSFSIFTRKARKIRDVQSGAVRRLRPTPQVAFSASSRLKAQIRA